VDRVDDDGSGPGATSGAGIHGEAPSPEVRLQLGEAEELLGLEAAGASAVARGIEQGLRQDEGRGRRDAVVAAPVMVRAARCAPWRRTATHSVSDSVVSSLGRVLRRGTNAARVNVCISRKALRASSVRWSAFAVRGLKPRRGTLPEGPPSGGFSSV
jgi:hypothetical protein